MKTKFSVIAPYFFDMPSRLFAMPQPVIPISPFTSESVPSRLSTRLVTVEIKQLTTGLRYFTSTESELIFCDRRPTVQEMIFLSLE